MPNLDTLLEALSRCNGFRRQDVRPLLYDNQIIGWLKHANVAPLQQWPRYFQISDTQVHLSPDLNTCAARTSALAEITAELHTQGFISGWRNELIAVHLGTPETALARIERAAGLFFGLWTRGHDINGWLAGSQGKPAHIWIARRSPTKQTFPNHLDGFCAGGLPFGVDLMDNVKKELWEEAGVPVEIAERAQPVGALFNCVDAGDLGLHCESNYTFDLLLPADFQPCNQDGEVAEFTRLPVDELWHVLFSDTPIAPSSYQVFTDFLLRHGAISPATSGYFEILNNLRNIHWPFTFHHF